MTKITGLYTSIYEKLKKLQDELDAVTQYDSAQLQMDEALRQRRIENLKEQLEKIDDYMAKAEYFRLLSEKNLTSKNILMKTGRRALLLAVPSIIFWFISREKKISSANTISLPYCLCLLLYFRLFYS